MSGPNRTLTARPERNIWHAPPPTTAAPGDRSAGSRPETTRRRTWGRTAAATAETTYTTRPRAEGWSADERRLIENHDWKPPAARTAAQAAAALTLADYAEAWLAQRRIKERTRVHYRALLERHINGALGNVALAELSPAPVRAWHAALAPDAPTLRAHAYGLLHGICKTAGDDELIAANPCRITGATKTHPRRQPAGAKPPNSAATTSARTSA